MLDIAIPQNTGYPVNNTGTAIEMCRDCPRGYQGFSCEECAQVNLLNIRTHTHTHYDILYVRTFNYQKQFKLYLLPGILQGCQ